MTSRSEFCITYDFSVKISRNHQFYDLSRYNLTMKRFNIMRQSRRVSCSVIFLGRFTKNHQFFGLSPLNLTINRTMSRDKVLDLYDECKEKREESSIESFQIFLVGLEWFRVGFKQFPAAERYPAIPWRRHYTRCFLTEKIMQKYFGYFLLFWKIDHTGRDGIGV